MTTSKASGRSLEKVTISGNTASALVTITQTGAGNALVVEDSASTDSTPFVIDQNGSVGIGTSSPSSLLHLSANSALQFTQERVGDTANPAIHYFYKARGTTAAKTVVQSGDIIGQTEYMAWSAAANAYIAAARIRAEVDGTPDSGGDTSDMPGRLAFWTSPDGSDAMTERMRINNAGNVGIGTSSPASKLHVHGTVRVDQAAPSGNYAALFMNSNATDDYGASFSHYNGNSEDSSVVVGGNSTNAARVSINTNPGSGITERLRVDSDGLITGSGTSLGAWTAYTPTVTAASGSFTTVSATGQYCRIGKVVHVVAKITITAHGTAADYVNWTLPTTTANLTNSYHGCGRETGVTGASLQVKADANNSTGQVFTTASNYPGGNGYILEIAMTYQTA